MNTLINKDEKMMLEAIKYLPSVSIIMPFRHIESMEYDVKHRLKIAVDKVDSGLKADYPPEVARRVIERLRRTVSDLRIDKGKRGIALYVSPIMEKTFYLDFPVNEKIIIDETFEIRDLVYGEKMAFRYLVLLLSTDSSKLYIGNNDGFTLLKEEVPVNIHANEKDLPEKVANFSDPDHLKETRLDKFLHQVDKGLSDALKEYPLPVFVTGVQKVLGHFKKNSVNERSLVAFINGNYMHDSEDRIMKMLTPHIEEWQNGREGIILQELEQAMSEKRAEFGIKQVWQAATLRQGRLLLVEKNYSFPAHQGSHPEIISGEDLSLNNPFYIKDAVDGVIEKVLAAGGDVEFVRDGVLKEYGQIALIKFY